MLLSQYLEVTEPSVGTRLDNYLAQHFPWRSRNEWKALIAQQAILVQGRSATKSLRLREGWKISPAPGFEHIFEQESIRVAMVVPNHANAQALSVLWRDQWLIAINKPAGMPSHPLKAAEADTALNALVALEPCTATAGTKALEGGLVHRLDTETSGVLLAATNLESFEKLCTIFRNHQAKKTYAALVHGEVRGTFLINLPIAHHFSDARRMVCVSAELSENETVRGNKKLFRGKPRPAETRVRVLSATKNYSLLEITVFQAQMHQIRVHLSALGHPLVADALYGKQESGTVPTTLVRRHALHAIRLEFPHPEDGTQLCISAPFPQDIHSSCKILGLDVPLEYILPP